MSLVCGVCSDRFVENSVKMFSDDADREVARNASCIQEA